MEVKEIKTNEKKEEKKKENWYALQRSRQHVSVLHRLTN